MTGATVEQLLEVARDQLGYHEGWNGRHWTNANKFGAAFGADQQPWCAWFVRWCMEHAKVQPGSFPLSGSCTTNMEWAKAHRRWFTTGGRAGDIAIFNSRVGGMRAVHTGIVERVVSTGVYDCIEGNTNTDGSPEGNAVLRRRRKADRIIGFIRPDYAPAPVKEAASVPTKTMTPWPEGAAPFMDLTADKPLTVEAGAYRELGRFILPADGRFEPSAAIRMPDGTWARTRWVRVGWGADKDGRDETGCNPLLPAPDGKATSYTPKGHAIKGGGPLAFEIKVYGAASVVLPVAKLMVARVA